MTAAGLSCVRTVHTFFSGRRRRQRVNEASPNEALAEGEAGPLARAENTVTCLYSKMRAGVPPVSIPFSLRELVVYSASQKIPSPLCDYSHQVVGLAVIYISDRLFN